jgi:glyoxylase-like metal-dependent hydrolase (beta-lactamase superfamily II)
MHPNWIRTTYAATLLIAAIVALRFTTMADAAAPMIKTSAPGYYRMMLGDFEVTALSDGTGAFPVDKLLTNTTPEKVDRALARAFLKSPVETSVNAYLVNTGSKLILIDTGGGRMLGPTFGRLVANLQAAGYKPEAVDDIYITHMHSDHAGGLIDGERIVFPNAIVHADLHEGGYWLDQAEMDRAPSNAKGSFRGAMATFNPYIRAGHFKTFDGDTSFGNGVKAIATRGHTPGHSTYAVESNGQTMLVLGDLIHVADVQFDDPTVTIQFDSDAQAAAVQRKREFDDAVKGSFIVAAAHVSFPGLGHLRANGKGYTWVPVNYAALP